MTRPPAGWQPGDRGSSAPGFGFWELTRQLGSVSQARPTPSSFRARRNRWAGKTATPTC